MTKLKIFKSLAITLFISTLMLSCSTQTTRRNPYLQEVNFSIEINLNLPTYSPLKIIGNPVSLSTSGVGTQGIILMNTGFDSFVAFEASCANHAPNSCSRLRIDGQNALCSCEDYQYSLFTGQLLNAPTEGRSYDLLAYGTRLNGNVLQVFN